MILNKRYLEKKLWTDNQKLEETHRLFKLKQSKRLKKTIKDGYFKYPKSATSNKKEEFDPWLTQSLLMHWFVINKNKLTIVKRSNTKLRNLVALGDLQDITMTTQTITGRLFDNYALKDKTILWRKEKNGNLKRLEHDWTPSVYVAPYFESDLKLLCKTTKFHHLLNNMILWRNMSTQKTVKKEKF